MRDWIWRFRVCFVGLRWHHIWVWSHLSTKEWNELNENVDNPEDAYVEGWCRE